MSTPYLSIEQKVECLNEQVGTLKSQLAAFLAVTEASLQDGLINARKIIEYLVGCVLHNEGIKPDRDLLNNIEILGGKESKGNEYPKRRRKNPSDPTPPPILPYPLYSSLHNLRIYGNLVTHPWDTDTMELKDVRVTSTDLQVALGQIMRLAEWYYSEYTRGPKVDPLYTGLPEPLLGRFSEAPPDVARFQGRANEVSDLRRLLADSPAKVVTLLASAGLGKTLLAARAALDVAGRWKGARGILIWVDLRGAPSFAEVSARILASVRPDADPADAEITQLSPAARVAQIVRAMAERPVLLVFDNFESWLDPRTRGPLDPAVGQFIEHVATRQHRGRVLVTSRVAADVPGVPAGSVSEMQVRPMSPEETQTVLLAEGLAGSTAAFADAWQRFGGNLRMLIMLAEVLRGRRCTNLDDGLKRFPALVAQKADGLLTQVWAELSPEAQRVLQALAVLRPPTEPADVDGLLQQLDAGWPMSAESVLWDELTPRALVSPSEDGTSFSVEHPIIADYALRQWADRTEVHRAAVRHFQSRLAPAQFSPMHLAVIHHAIAAGDWTTAAETLTSDVVKDNMRQQGRSLELWELCRPIVAQIDGLPATIRVRLRRLAATAIESLGDYPAAMRLFDEARGDLAAAADPIEECRLLERACGVLRKLNRFDDAKRDGHRALELARTHGWRKEEASALITLAAVEQSRGKPWASAQLAQEAIVVADLSGEPAIRALARTGYARTLISGANLGPAEKLFRETLEFAKQSGYQGIIAQTLSFLAGIARRRTRNDEALALCDEALAISMRIRHRTVESIMRRCRGLTLLKMGKGRRPEALPELRHGLRLALDLDHPREVANALDDLVEAFASATDAAMIVACRHACEVLEARTRWAGKRTARALAALREQIEKSGGDWAAIETEARERRDELLETASGIPAATWSAYLGA